MEENENEFVLYVISNGKRHKGGKSTIRQKRWHKMGQVHFGGNLDERFCKFFVGNDEKLIEKTEQFTKTIHKPQRYYKTREDVPTLEMLDGSTEIYPHRIYESYIKSIEDNFNQASDMNPDFIYRIIDHNHPEWESFFNIQNRVNTRMPFSQSNNQHSRLLRLMNLMNNKIIVKLHNKVIDIFSMDEWWDWIQNSTRYDGKNHNEWNSKESLIYNNFDFGFDTYSRKTSGNGYSFDIEGWNKKYYTRRFI